jgi:hypothetical protein
LQIFQVTIGSNGKAQFPTLPDWPQYMTVQNNSSDNMRVGDVSVVAGAYGTGKGILISSNGGAFTFQLGQDYSTRTSEWWVAGTSGDVLDVIII